MSKQAARDLTAHEVIGPPLLWSEVHSAIHEAGWRGEIDSTQAQAMFGQFDLLAVRRRRPGQLYRTAVEIADELGWAKTYDAEFIALARIERAVVLTTDARMRRGADRTGLVIDPSEL